MHAVRFYFDGEVLRETQTPAEAGMEDGDVIDASVELTSLDDLARAAEAAGTAEGAAALADAIAMHRDVAPPQALRRAEQAHAKLQSAFDAARAHPLAMDLLRATHADEIRGAIAAAEAEFPSGPRPSNLQRALDDKRRALKALEKKAAAEAAPLSANAQGKRPAAGGPREEAAAAFGATWDELQRTLESGEEIEPLRRALDALDVVAAALSLPRGGKQLCKKVRLQHQVTVAARARLAALERARAEAAAAVVEVLADAEDEVAARVAQLPR